MNEHLSKAFANICASIDGFKSIDDGVFEESEWAIRMVVDNDVHFQLFGIEGRRAMPITTFGPFSWQDADEIDEALAAKYPEAA